MNSSSERLPHTDKLLASKYLLGRLHADATPSLWPSRVMILVFTTGKYFNQINENV